MVTRAGVLAPAPRKACRAGVARVVFRCVQLADGLCFHVSLYLSLLLCVQLVDGLRFHISLYLSLLLYTLLLLYTQSGKCLLLRTCIGVDEVD